MDPSVGFAYSTCYRIREVRSYALATNFRKTAGANCYNIPATKPFMSTTHRDFSTLLFQVVQLMTCVASFPGYRESGVVPAYLR